MPPRADSRKRSSAASAQGASAPSAASAAAASGGPSTSAEQPPQPPEFLAEKLQWALAVPPEQRQPSVQEFIDSCECTTEATRLLAAAPLAQLPGPTKLRALLLLLKAHWCSDGRLPAMPGLNMLPFSASWEAPEQARSNLKAFFIHEDAFKVHPDLQPLYAVAAKAGYAVMLAAHAMADIQAASVTNSSVEVVSQSLTARRLSRGLQQKPLTSLDDAARALESLLDLMRPLRPLLQEQLAGVGGALLTVQQLERELLVKLAAVHTWAATPDGAYCGGRIDEQHAAAGRAAFSEALELSNGEFCNAGLLAGLSNVLRRIGAEAEGQAALRRAVAAARAAEDSFRELNAAAALAGCVTTQDGWSYLEVEGLVAAMQRCLKDCKPWLLSPIWSNFRERARQFEVILDHARRALPTSYASRPLPGTHCTSSPNTFMVNKAAKKIGACSGCGGKCLELKFCARCRTAKYCSRACQAQHWRAGHKAECVPVEARKDGGSHSS